MAKETTLVKEALMTQHQAMEHVARMREVATVTTLDPTIGPCWERDQALQNGYPAVTIQGVGYKAHRIACIAANGHAPMSNAHAAHLCNNPKCINPDHLVWKTAAENARDRLLVEIKETGLKEGDVLDIFQRGRAQTATFAELATEYAISVELVKLIINGKKWKQVTKHLAHKHNNTPYQSIKKISDHDAAVIICLKDAGFSSREIEMAFNYQYNWNTLRNKGKRKSVATLAKQLWEGEQLFEVFKDVGHKIETILVSRN